jgi:hypothetical protein
MNEAQSDTPAEEWRAIPDVIGYEASTLGRVRSIDRVITDSRGHSFFRPGFVLTPGTCGHKNRQYHFVGLSHKSTRKSTLLHRIIAKTFIPNPDNRKTVDHIDNNRLNNCVSNLRWATYKENNCNKATISSTGHRNIHVEKRTGKYAVRHKVDKKQVGFGTYDTIEAALAARKTYIGF